VPRDRAALQLGERALEERHAVTAELVWHAVELVEACRREASRHVFVSLAEEVHREAIAVAQRGIALRLVIDTHEDLRRIERDGAERAHRESRRTAVGVACGHDRHSGREVTENTAKLVGRDHPSYVSGSVGKNQARASPGRPALAGGRASNVLLGSTLNETAAC